MKLAVRAVLCAATASAGCVRNGSADNWVTGAYLLRDEAPTNSVPDAIRCRINIGGSNLAMERVRDRIRVVSSTAPFASGASATLALGAEQLGGPPHCEAATGSVPAPLLTTQLLLATDATDPERARLGVFTVNARADFVGIVVYETTHP